MKAALFCFLLVLAAGLRAEDRKGTADLEELIGGLVKTEKVGFGYSAQFAGSQFLPRDDSGRWGMGILGASGPSRSDTLTKLVEEGARAIPVLVNHLDDKRPTRIKPVAGMMWMAWNDEYDHNRRTRKEAPAGVNRDEVSEDGHPEKHQITVGDLCFVALGQIVNRSFNATRYQPTGGLVVNSPTYSKPLRDAVRGDYAKMTREEHRAQLVRDFRKPDFEERRNGAAMRLAYYYPETLEPLVLAQLKVPTFDVFVVSDFVREVLYPAKSARRRKALMSSFVAKHGAAARDGILIHLFEDLDMQEADEQGRLHPPLFPKHPARACLIQLCGYGPKVRSTEVPSVKTWAATDLARFVEAMGPGAGKEIDREIHRIFSGIKDDDYLALACMEVLKGKGHDEEFMAYCKRRMDDSLHEGEALAEMLRQLQAGGGRKEK